MTPDELLGRIGDYVRHVDPSLEELTVPTELDASYVLDELIPNAQRRVGHSWESAAWTVAQEHDASDQALRIIEALSQLRGTESTGKRALFACAEGEWHSLAVTALATGFARSGWQVMVARPATQATQLAAQIHDFGAHVVAISCSMGANLPGARKAIAGAIDTGTPVIAGGAAFGRDPARAHLLNATAWAPNIASALDVATSLRGSTPPSVPLDHEYAAEFHLLESRSRDITDAISEALDLGHPDDLDRVETAAWALRAVKGALLCADPAILGDHLRWLSRRTAAAGTPGPDFVVGVLQQVLPPEAVRSRELLAA